MTAEYRGTLIKLLADHARAELVAAARLLALGAPGARIWTTKLHLAGIAREETEHWYRAIRLLSELGVSPETARRYRTRSWFYATAADSW